MSQTAKLSEIDEKVRDICWTPKYRNVSLDDAATELAEWAQANGWPAMTKDQARNILSEEGNAGLLRPAGAVAHGTPASRVAAFLDARAGMSNVDQAEVMTIYRNDQRHVLTVADLRALIDGRDT